MGKYRYVKKERVRIYGMLYNLLKEQEKDLFIYLCMERKDIWRSVTGMTPEDNEALMGLFDSRIKTLYGGIL